MKTEKRVLDVVSTLEGEKIGMTIHEDALAHIMSVLTDLYSDPELAVIREYSTNAFDAHVEAGITRPIEVTTPTALSPYFKVRDYGEGLDIEDIRNIYSRYGASTKRESDDVVGMLGLGCKSALTYTDQFTMSAVKNSVMTQVSISRDEDGSGSMTVVAEYETDEPNGVEITVPAKRYNQFDTKAAQFFRFWSEGTVLVNGEAPKKIDGLWISDKLLLTTEVDDDYVVMGNVAYPTGEYTYGKWKTVAFVNIGEVNFTPSRETLQMTPKTKKKLEDIKLEVKEKRDDAIKNQINNASDRAEALKLVQWGVSLGYRGDATFQGQPIPREFRAEKDGIFTVVSAEKSWGARGWNREVSLPVAAVLKSVWLVGYTEEGFTPYKRKKLNQWLDKQTDIQRERDLHFILVDKLPKSDWINPKAVKNWADVAAEKIERNTTVSKTAGTYKFAVVSGTFKYNFPAAEIDAKLPLFFLPQNGNIEEARQMLNKHYPKGYTLIALGKNRLAKFQRDYPKATQITHDWYQKMAKKWWNKLSQDAKLSLALSYRGIGGLNGFDAEQINDPALKAIIEAAKYKNAYNLYDEWRRSYRNYVEIPTDSINALNNYPLLTTGARHDMMNDKTKEHFYMYFKAVFAAEKEQN